MNRPRDLLSELTSTLAAPRDDLMLEAGAVGELLVARIRLVAAGLIFLMPPIAWLTGAPPVEVLNGALVASVALVFALFLLREARRHGISVPLRYVSTAFDVTSISLVLTLFLVQGLPHTAVNSRVVWELYLVAIAATALRGDPRVCVFGGALAILQYIAVIAGALSYGDLSDSRFAPFAYGFFSWGDQISRLIVLGLATLISLASVMQTCRLLVMSSQDRMTGARNRAYLDARLSREIREARVSRAPLTLAMIDVDHFKAFNDREGHLAGDAVLAGIAGELRGHLHGGFLARYGGEEFTAVFPGIAADRAAENCDRARRGVAGRRFPKPGGEPVEAPTVSIGVAQWNGSQSAEELIDAADRALIRAKRAGRNRVAVDGVVLASEGPADRQDQ